MLLRELSCSPGLVKRNFVQHQRPHCRVGGSHRELSPRQREVLNGLLSGRPNKVIVCEFGNAAGIIGRPGDYAPNDRPTRRVDVSFIH